MALPTEQRPIRMDPELSAKVEALMENLSDSDQEKARSAVMEVYQSGYSGSFGQLLERYEAAIQEAVGD